MLDQAINIFGAEFPPPAIKYESKVTDIGQSSWTSEGMEAIERPNGWEQKGVRPIEDGERFVVELLQRQSAFSRRKTQALPC